MAIASARGRRRIPGVPRPRSARSRPVSALHRRLDRLLDDRDAAVHRQADPVAFVHQYGEPADREIVGLVAATLAFGNVKTIRASVTRVLAVLGERPAHVTATLGEQGLREQLDGFVHRVYRGPDVARMLGAASAMQRAHGSLGRAFADHYTQQADLRPALASFADQLRGPEPGAGLAHLVSDPRAGSACKRLLLYLRWMIRPADGVDLGLWPLPSSSLIIPLDTHVHRIACNLRLTDRRTPSWRTAEEITERLRQFDAEDPVKYDFALCHLGVSRDCPSRRDPHKCAGCVLRQVCRQWRSETRATTRGTRRAAVRAP
jgi:uncharacterized protein (TIGR02757 family)